MNLAATLAPIQRMSLHEELAERLEAVIVAGELAPGTKVPERQLCEDFGVSRRLRCSRPTP